MPTLAEVREQLTEKRGRLAEIFKQAGTEVDLGKVTLIEGDEAAKLLHIQRANEELTGLGKQYDELAAVERLAQANGKALGDLQTPQSRPAFPSGTPAEREQAAEASKGIGQLFVESVAYKSYDRMARKGPTVELPIGDRIGVKAVLTETGFAPQAIRTGLIQPAPLRRPVIADLMPGGTTTQNAIVYMLETTTTNAAAATSEGATKPESTLAFTEVNSPVRKIATVLPITDELLADVPALQSYIEARLRIFLMLAEESELYSGAAASAPHITGLVNTTNILTQPRGADNAADAIYKAMINIETTAFLSASGVVMHPTDWQGIRLMKTSIGSYLWGDPATAAPERVWGIDVVRTPAATQGTALVGAFDSAAQVFRREGVSFAISDQHSDFFIRNQLMLRIEERLALAVYRPQAFSTVTGL